ncbi:MAG: translation initiation factor IF-3 [Parcubacteria group bacterium]|nr:translation initiation factor IF-3 [Parcubacteria group bacterium]
MQKRIFINNQIRSPQVRVIDQKGKQVGVVTLQEALGLARASGLDLIQVTERVDPPVCRIGEYGKYLYQLEKKAREGRKHEGGDMKEVRLTFNISKNDLETRVRQAEKFLAKGDRVRVVLPLRGRQKALEGFAREKMGLFLASVKEHSQAKVEREVKREPRGLSMIIGK